MRLVITFKTTSQALGWEKMCKEQDLPGRLIAVPREVTAGCGYAWQAEPADKQMLLEAAQAAGKLHEGVFELED